MSPEETLILLAPGAGAPSSSEWMQGWAARLGGLGRVVTLDYDYAREGRKAPDRLPKLLAAHARALAAARAAHPDRPRVVLCGKSMGSRVGCHLSLEQPVDGLVCLGYPLQGAGSKAPLRDEVLVALRAPILFVQGTRDPLCPLDLLAEVRARMQGPTALHVVEEGDHSLLVTQRHLRASGLTQEASDQAALAAVAAFLAGLR